MPICIQLSCIALALLAAPAWGQSRVNWSGTTWAEIRPTEAPGAVAEIVFVNDAVNVKEDNFLQTVKLGDFAVDLLFKWQARASDGADSITATPPAGYIAVPDVLIVREGAMDRLLIYPEGAVGW